MKVALVGNPNVGKSAVFNRLTGASVIVSNYPGTTVEFTRGTMRLGGQHAEVVDLPGTYSLEPTCKAEEVTAQALAELAPGDVILNVVDSTNLERGLGLTLQLTRLRKPMALALNMWDEAKHTGVQIDVPVLEKSLGVPCVPVVAITGEGIRTWPKRSAKPQSRRTSLTTLSGGARSATYWEMLRNCPTATTPFWNGWAMPP